MGYLWSVFFLGALIFSFFSLYIMIFGALSILGCLALFVKLCHCFFPGKLLKGNDLPKEEENFQKAYVKAPSFLSIHMGVKAEVLPPDTDCHHFVLEVFKLKWPCLMEISSALECKQLVDVFPSLSCLIISRVTGKD